jgi:hypothetical protein
MVQGYLRAIPVNLTQDVNGIYTIGFVQPAGEGQSAAETWYLVAPRLSETEAKQLGDIIDATLDGAKLEYNVTVDFRPSQNTGYIYVCNTKCRNQSLVMYLIFVIVFLSLPKPVFGMLS